METKGLLAFATLLLPALSAAQDNGPIFTLDIDTDAHDVRPEGPSVDVGDLLEGQSAKVSISVTLVEGPFVGPVAIGYGVSPEWLGVEKVELFNVPKMGKDKKLQTLLDPGKAGALEVKEWKVGETRRLTVSVIGAAYSLGHEPLAWGAVVDLDLESTVRLDVYGADHWEFSGTVEQTEGWGPTAKVADGRLVFDGAVVSDEISVETEEMKGFVMRLKSSVPGKGRLLWREGQHDSFDDERSREFSVKGNGHYQKIPVDVSKSGTWGGNVVQIRLEVPGSTELDWLAAKDKVEELPEEPEPCADGPNDTPEICNLVDDNCDGDVDEGFDVLGACSVGEGECVSEGFTTCSADGEAYCKASQPSGTPERCDAVDNDCDGDVDEGFAAGKPCEIIEVDCVRKGVWACDSTGSDVVCIADPCGEATQSSTDGGGSTGAGDTTGSEGGGTGSAAAGSHSGGGPGEGVEFDVGGPEETGCAASPSGHAPWWGMLLLLFFVVRRRTV